MRLAEPGFAFELFQQIRINPSEPITGQGMLKILFSLPSLDSLILAIRQIHADKCYVRLLLNTLAFTGIMLTKREHILGIRTENI